LADALLAQLSDPHMRIGAEDEGTGAAFEAAVAAVADLDPQPHAVLLSGDLAEHADPREYERVRELLAPLLMPVHVLPGNHDDPAAVPAWYAVPCGKLRLVACDSTVPAEDGGSFGPERLSRLEQLLAEDPRTATVVAMHHPPIDIGVEAADAIGLPREDRAALGELLDAHPQVRRVVAGHVHRGAAGRVGNCPVFTCPSTWRQGALDLRPGAPLQLSEDRPAFALHVLLDGEVTSHVQPI
jgi:3',5'-cyclic-AMP phosphodiesterase